MASLERLRALVDAGDLGDLHAALSAKPHACTHMAASCPNGGTKPCPVTIGYLADQAVRNGKLDVWLYIFDDHLKTQGGSISWDSIQHITRRGDTIFATSFQSRQPGWANSIQPKGIRGEPQTMSVAKLAMMHGNLDFVDHIINNCGCDINAGWPQRSPVRMVVGMELGDDECMRRLEFLVERGAYLDGTGAIEAVEMMSRPPDVIERLRVRCTEERERRIKG